MPDRKEPRLTLSEAQQQAQAARAEAAKPSSSTEKTSEPPHQASEAARAEVRRRLAEQEAKQAQKPNFTSTSADESGQGQTKQRQEGSTQSRSVNKSGSRAGTPWWSLLALVLALAALAFGGWQFSRAQNQQQAMESLAARIQELEIRLSETGQDLTETGSNFSQRLEAHSDKLDWADSEIRKLWVVAHQRNRPAIAELQEQLSRMDRQLTQATQQAEQAASQGDRLASRLDTELTSVQSRVETVSESVAGYARRLTEISLVTSTLSQQVRELDPRSGIERLEGELKNVQQQLVELERQQVNAVTQERLEEFEEILASLEASRNQLTSRVTRLMDEVRELQQGR